VEAKRLTAEADPPPYVRTATDDEQATWLDTEMRRNVRFDHESQKWYMWSKVLWAEDRNEQVQRRVMDLATERLTATATDPGLPETTRTKTMAVYRKLLNMRSAEGALEALRTRVGYYGSDWDRNTYLLGCVNTIVDLRTGLAIPSTVDQLVTKSTRLRFIPMRDDEKDEDRAPLTMNFLREITSHDEAQVEFLLNFFAYSLFGVSPERKFLILTGIGSNGKSVLANVIGRVFGEYDATVDGSLYMRRRGLPDASTPAPQLLALQGARIAFMAEPQGGAFNEEMLKAHTGGDEIAARTLYSKLYTRWRATHSIVFMTNEPPALTDIGPSMQDRVLLADFREHYEGATMDTGLTEKLYGEDEGLLAILIRRAAQWAGKFVIPKRVREASAAYIESNDPVGRALEVAFVLDPAARTGATAMYGAYLEFEDDEPVTQTEFGLALNRHGLRKKKTMHGYVYVGIRPKNAMELADAEAE
jgi:putative DNA primase/helicase